MAFLQKTICCGLIFFNSAIGMDTATASSWILPPEMLHKILYVSLDGTWLNKFSTGLRLRLINRSTANVFTVESILANIKSQPDDLTTLLIDKLMSIPLVIGKTLIDQGAAINKAQDNDGNTLVHLAAIHGNADRLTKLIALGANKNQTNFYDQTPMMCVTASQHQIRKILLGDNATVAANQISNSPTHTWKTISS